MIWASKTSAASSTIMILGFTCWSKTRFLAAPVVVIPTTLACFKISSSCSTSNSFCCSESFSKISCDRNIVCLCASTYLDSQCRYRRHRCRGCTAHTSSMSATCWSEHLSFCFIPNSNAIVFSISCISSHVNLSSFGGVSMTNANSSSSAVLRLLRSAVITGSSSSISLNCAISSASPRTSIFPSLICFCIWWTTGFCFRWVHWSPVSPSQRKITVLSPYLGFLWYRLDVFRLSKCCSLM